MKSEEQTRFQQEDFNEFALDIGRSGGDATYITFLLE
jgi:hypothetical protein